MKVRLRLLMKRLCVVGLATAAIVGGASVPSVTSINVAYASADNPYPETYPGHSANCTWQAWEQVYKRLGVKLPDWDNASNWCNGARNSGYTVVNWYNGYIPPNDCIMQWNGHVGYILNADANGATVIDGNFHDNNGNCIKYYERYWTWAELSRYRGNPVGCILVKPSLPPTNAHAEQNQFWYDIKDTIHINAYADNATYYEICIDDSKGKRIVEYQPMNGNEYSIAAKDLGGIDDYVFTIIAKNSAGAIQSSWYKIPVCGRAGYSNVEASKSVYNINDTVQIKVDTIIAKGQVIGIDRGSERVITQDCPATYTISASKLGVGDYSAYFSVYNGSGSIDTKRVYFKIIVPVERVDIAYCVLWGNDLTFDQGDSKNLGESITPANATNKNVTWSSSDPSVVSVDATGTIKALKPGTATITVKTEDGGKTASCTVTVKPTEATGIALDKKLLVLNKGKSGKLTATVKPDNATNKTVTWTSSNTNVATVDKDGNVTAVNHGTAKITAKTSNGKTAECEVQVNADSFTGVKKDGGQLKRFRSGAVDTAYTGLDQYPEDGKWYYFAKGIHGATYTGLAKSTDGKFYYVKNGMWDTTYTGFAKYTDGKWYFVKDGRYDTSYTGLAYSEPSKGWFYSDKGVYNNKYTGIAKSTDGKLYYAKNGRWDTSYTGLAEYTDGKWYYTEKGRFNSSYTGLAKSTNGRFYYVKKGMWDTTYTGFAKYTDGKWYFVKNGRYDTSYTGLAYSEPSKGWFYSDKGVYNNKYTGIAKSTDGKMYYAKNGRWDTSYTGLAQYTDGNWYYVKDGRHQTYTGVCKSTNGLLYYAKNGVWDTSYTGLAQYHADGKWYYVKNGRHEAYTGVCKSTNGMLYYAKNGLWDTSYTGLAQYHADGKWYYVKNGRHEAYTGVCKSTNGKLYYAKNGVWDTTFTGSAKNENGTVYNVKNGRV